MFTLALRRRGSSVLASLPLFVPFLLVVLETAVSIRSSNKLVLFLSTTCRRLHNVFLFVVTLLLNRRQRERDVLFSARYRPALIDFSRLLVVAIRFRRIGCSVLSTDLKGMRLDGITRTVPNGVANGVVAQVQEAVGINRDSIVKMIAEIIAGGSDDNASIVGENECRMLFVMKVRRVSE